MAKAYQHDASGFFVGEIEDCGLLPHNATYVAPEHKEGFIAQFKGSEWHYVENHVTQQGYVNGNPFTVKEYGALPEGWSDTKPEPTTEEQYFQEKDAIDAKYTNEKIGTLCVLKNAIVAALCNPSQESETLERLKNNYQTTKDTMQKELDALDAKYQVA